MASSQLHNPRMQSARRRCSSAQLLLILGVSFFVSCERSVDVQVVKLGGVEVHAIPFRDAKRAVDNAIEARQRARREIDKEEASQSEEYARKEAVVKQAEARQKQAESTANQAIQDFAKQVHSAVKSARD